MSRAPKRAIYAGTFDPITNGHYDIIIRALGVFDEVVVAVVEESKKKTLFSSAERRELVSAAVATLAPDQAGRVVVESFSGLLVDYVKSKGSRTIVRGLRAVSDYEYEGQMAIINRHLAPEVDTIFLMTSDHVSFISSSVVREIARNGGDVAGLVPDAASKKLAAVYPRRIV